MYLLDTNVLVDFYAARTNTRPHAQGEQCRRLQNSIGGQGAELFGVEKSADPGPNRLKAELLLLPFEASMTASALHYARIRAHLGARHAQWRE